MKRIINENHFGQFDFQPLRKAAAEAASRRDFRVYETTSITPAGWTAVETSADHGQNNYPGLEFAGEQSTEIERVLSQYC